MAGLQGKAEWNEFLLLPLLRRRFSLLTIIDLFLVALLSLVCLVLTDSSSLVTRLTEECHRSDGEWSLQWQAPAVAYPFLDHCTIFVVVVVVPPDEQVLRKNRQVVKPVDYLSASARDWYPMIGKHFNPLEMVNTHTHHCIHHDVEDW